ncbi:MAG: LacI family transcriptional regulator [Alphaproteobacteria bacterium]|nr:LacI family transcriptional regulator [Alphaproteobacteria bacterium]
MTKNNAADNETDALKIRTMEELSTRVGISRPTLSRYFQDAGSVRPSTRQRIEAALRDIDYVPNFFATKMNRKSTGLIGVIVPHLSDLFYTSLIEAIETTALETDHMVITQNSLGDPVLEARAIQNLISMSADGVIMAPIGEASSLSAVARLKEHLPTVFVDSRFPNEFQDVDYVGTNNTQSVSLIVDYLCRSGESPVFLGMPRLNSNSLERENAYRASVTEHGFEAQVIAPGIAQSGWNFEEYGFRLMDEYFSRGQYVGDTILCANDRLAIGAIRAVHRHRLFKPDAGRGKTVRIAGHDDHPLSAYVYPSLTTVAQNSTAMARAAVEQLVDQISNGRRSGAGVVRRFDAELRLRDSA